MRGTVPGGACRLWARGMLEVAPGLGSHPGKGYVGTLLGIWRTNSNTGLLRRSRRPSPHRLLQGKYNRHTREKHTSAM